MAYNNSVKIKRKEIDNCMATTITTTKGRVWEPNPNQKNFLKVLSSYSAPVSLMEITVDTGVRFVSGIVTPLVKRGIVIAQDADISCDIVFKGAKVGTKVNHVKVYSLAAAAKTAADVEKEISNNDN